MASNVVSLVIEIDSKGEPVIRRVVGGLESIEKAAKRSGASLAQNVTAASTSFLALDRIVSHVANTISGAVSASFGRLQSNAERFVGLSRSFGVPVAQISRLAYVADQAGASVEDLVQGMRQFATALGQTPTRVGFVEKLGISLKDLRALAGRDLPAALVLAAEAVAKIENQAVRAEAASRLFGRGFSGVLKVALEGEGAFARLAKRADELGETLDERVARQVRAVGTAQRDLLGAVDGLTKKIADQGGILKLQQQSYENLTERVQKFTASLSPEQLQTINGYLVAMREIVTGLSEVFLTLGVRAAAAVTDLLRIGQLHFGGVSALFEGADLALQRGGRLSKRGQSFATPQQLASISGDFSAFQSTASPEQLAELGAFRPSARASGGGGGGFGLSSLGDPEGGAKADQLKKRLADLQLALDTATGKLDATQSKVQAILADFAEFGPEVLAKVRPQAEALVAAEAKTEAALASYRRQAELLKEPTAANVEALKSLADVAAHTTGPMEDVAKAAQELRDKAQDMAIEVAKAGRELEQTLQERLEDLLDPAAKVKREFDDLRTKAKDLGRTDLLPLVDQLEAVSAAAEAFGKVFDEVERGIQDVFEGLILGTSKTEDAFKHLALAIVRSFTEVLVHQATQQLMQLLLRGVASGGSGGGLLGGLGGLLGFGAGGGGSIGVGVGTVLAGQSSDIGAFISGGGGSAPGVGTVLAPGGGGGGGFAIPDTFGVPTLATNALTGGGIGGGAGSIGSALTAWAGLIVSLGLASKGLADSRASNSALTLGTNQAARNNLTGVGAGLIGGFAAGGAAVGATAGTIAFPGIGSGLGALIGAAVGAAVGSGVSNALSAAVGKGIAEGTKLQDARRGLSQQQLDKDVRSNTMMITEILGGIGSVGISNVAGDPLSDALIKLFTPGIEPILQKIFRQAIGQGGGRLNTEGVTGQGPEGKALRAELAGVRGEAHQLARVISVAIGGGAADKGPRIAGFTNLLLGGVGNVVRKTGDQPEDVLRRALRGVFQNDLVTALQAVAVFKGAREGGARDVRDPVQRAFAAGLPRGTDVEAFSDIVLRKGAGFFDPESRKKSRQAVAEALPNLFQEGGVNNFASQLISVFQRSFTEGISKAIAQGTIGNLLAGLFTLSRRTRRRIRRNGLDEETTDLIQQDVQQGITDFTAAIAALQPALEQLAAVGDIIQKAQIQFQVSTGDRQGARNTIMEMLAPARETFEGFRALAESAAARAEVGAAGGQGFAAQEAQVRVLRRQADTARERLLDFAGVTDINAVGQSAAVRDNLQESLPLLQQFSEAQLGYLEASLQLAQQQKALFESLKAAFQGLKDQITVFRGARAGQRSLIDRDMAEARELLPKALGGDVESAQRLQAILPSIVNTAIASYAPGSQRLQDILTFADDASTKLADKFGKLADEQTQIITDLRDQFTAFSEGFVPTLVTLQGAAQQFLQSEFQKIVDKLGIEGDLYGILKSIAAELGVEFTGPSAGSGASAGRDPAQQGAATDIGRGFHGQAEFNRNDGQGFSALITLPGATAPLPVHFDSNNEWVHVPLTSNPKVWVNLQGNAIQTWFGNPPGPAGGEGQGGAAGADIPLFTPQPRAAGGPIVPGQNYIVGEHGPEVFRMGAGGGRITPWAQAFAGDSAGRPTTHGEAGDLVPLLEALLERHDRGQASLQVMIRQLVATLREDSRGGGEAHIHLPVGGDRSESKAEQARWLASVLRSNAYPELNRAVAELTRR